MIDLSVLIVARNEEENIAECLTRCLFAKEIIVIDDYSTDNTAHIAKKLGAKVIERALDNDWGKQKTFAIEKANCNWILILDADERISDKLAIEIQQAVIKNEPCAYFIKRENKFKYNKATHGVLRPEFVCRLMPKLGSSLEGKVHEAVITPYTQKKIKSPLFHYTYNNWEQYFNKFNKYTTVAALKYQNNNKKIGFVNGIIIKPFWAFLKVYFFHGGFLDGKLGWILSVNHYFYTMQKYVKLYYLNKSNGKL